MEISSGVRPSLTNRVNDSHCVTSSGASRARFSINEASSAAASSPASMIAQGTGSAMPLSFATNCAARKRRLPATISNVVSLPPSAGSGQDCCRTNSGMIMPRARIDGRMPVMSGGFLPLRILAGEIESRSRAIWSSFMALTPLGGPILGASWGAVRMGPVFRAGLSRAGSAATLGVKVAEARQARGCGRRLRPQAAPRPR